MAQLNDIIQWCNQTLKSHEFKDYAPNGLQIEGKSEVNKIVCAVTASQEAIEAAIYYVSKKARSKGILYARYQQELETLSIWKRSQQSLQKSWLENIEKQFNEQMKLRKAA